MVLRHLTVLFCLAAALLAMTAWPQQAWAGKRLALVIGIDSYREIPVLQKATGDARALSAALQSLGFDVTTVLDADRRTLNRSVAEFQARLGVGDIALVHFSGHGVELDGQNYLLPSDVPRPQSSGKDFVKSESLGMAELMERVAASGARTRIFIIDACRDNPFAQSGVRGIGTSRGLARVEAPAGTFIMYSAGYGQQALDRLGDGDKESTSVYTRVLLQELSRQGKQISEIARDVRLEVERMARSLGHEQRPAYYDELSAGFYFAGAPDAPAPAPMASAGVAPQIRTPPDALNERVAFETAKSIDTEAAWDAFLGRFPTGFYADMAKAARDKLQQAASSPPPASVPPVASLAPPPQPQGTDVGRGAGAPSSYWNHNGSVVYLVAEGNRRAFYYHRPRSGMLQAGARPHDLLFEGWKEGNSYKGTAYLFSPVCGKAAYQVSGSVQNGDRRVVMQGTAPRLDNSCRAVSY
ncbi:MAG: caspase domain-containing protein, partial [Hyphomicrobiales bacterium]